MKTFTLAFAALLAASQAHGFLQHPTIVSHDEKGARLVARADKGVQAPIAFPRPDASTSQGCFSSPGNLTVQSKIQMLSSGSCHQVCHRNKFLVMGLHGADCYCGFVYPPASKIVDDPNCNYPCPGYDLEACGGLKKGGFWSIYNTGVNIQVENMEEPTSSSSSSTKSSSSSDDGGPESGSPSVIIQTQIATPTSDADDKLSGPNVAGIAAGTVVGVVAAAALIGGIIFFIRRHRKTEIEEEHRRNAAVNAFINGSKPPGSSGSISMTDARLDPVLSHRRMSDGSIADNEDYSRRILRVTNA